MAEIFLCGDVTLLLQEKNSPENIADGLAAAGAGHRTLEFAEIKSKELIMEAKAQAAHILEQANQRA